MSHLRGSFLFDSKQKISNEESSKEDLLKELKNFREEKKSNKKRRGELLEEERKSSGFVLHPQSVKGNSTLSSQSSFKGNSFLKNLIGNIESKRQFIKEEETKKLEKFPEVTKVESFENNKESRKKRSYWKKNLLPINTVYNLEYLREKAPFFKKLSKLDLVFLRLFWPNRSLTLSSAEIAEGVGLSKTTANALMLSLENQGFLKTVRTFLKREINKTVSKKIVVFGKTYSFPKKETVEIQTKIAKRNFFELAPKGKKLIKEILNKAFKNSSISTCFDFSLPKSFDVKKILGERKKLPKGSNKLLSYSHFKRTFNSVFDKVFPVELLKKWGLRFESFFPRTLFPGHLKKIFSFGVEKIRSCLLFLRKKIENGSKIRNFIAFIFWAFGSSEKKREFTEGNQRKARVYLEVVRGEVFSENKEYAERLKNGKLSQSIISSLKILDRDRKLSEKDVLKMFAHSKKLLLVQKHKDCFDLTLLEIALKFVVFRSRVIKIKNWIAYVLWCLSKHPEEINGFYKR